MLSYLKSAVLDINPEDVLKNARENDLDVQSVEDFRDFGDQYEKIEKIMDDYRSSYANFSALGGMTTGIGGFATSITFAGIDTVSLSIQLYRLSQRFAILNGFDGSDPLQKDNMINIYFEALGINAVAQAALKHQLLKASALAGSKEISENLVLSLIARISRIFGQNISSKNAGRLIPVFGGMVGAGLNYSFAIKTSETMKDAYKRAYFDNWD